MACGPPRDITKWVSRDVFPIEIRLAVSTRCQHKGDEPSDLPGLLCVLTVAGTELIRSLKRVLEDASKTPSRYQRWTYQAKDLKNDLSVGEQGITSGARILLESIVVDKMEFFRDIPQPEFDNLLFVRYLLYNKADPKATDERGSCILHSLAERGIILLAKSFLRDPKFTACDARDSQGATALHRAAVGRQVEACKLLIKEERFTAMNEADDQGATALHRAAEHGLLEVCQSLLETPAFVVANSVDWSGATALHIAAARSQRSECHYLITHERFQSVNVRDKSGATALHRAAGSGLADVCWTLIQDGNFECPEARNWQGLNAAQVAANQGHTEVSALLQAPLQPLCDPRLNPDVIHSVRQTVRRSGKGHWLRVAEIFGEDPKVTEENSRFVFSHFGPLAESCMYLVDGYRWRNP